jgi:hypothetical protein
MKCGPGSSGIGGRTSASWVGRGDEGHPDRKTYDGDTGNQARMGEPGSDAAFFDHAAHQ